MNISRHNDHTIDINLTNDDRRGIRGCIRETCEKLKDKDIIDLTGVGQDYLDSIVDYFGQVRYQCGLDARSQSSTLSVVKINDDEYHLSMSRQDTELIVKCLITALRVIPDWEFPIILGVEPSEVKEMIEQFNEVL